MLKPIFKYVFIFSFFGSFFAQDSDENLISRYRPGALWFFTGIRPAEPERVRKYDRLIVDLVYNDWQSKDVKPFKVSPLSIGFNANLMFDIPLAKNNVVSLGTGISYGLFHVNSDDFFKRNEVSKSTELISDIKQYGIEKSTFNMNTLSVPLELRFRGKNWKHAKIHLGAKVTYQFHASTNLSSKFNGITNQQKTIGFYDLNPLNVSSHIRFGIRNWSFFASYSYLKIFKSDVSTKLNPFQFGVSLSLF